MINYQLHHKQRFCCPNIQPYDAGEELRSYTNGGHKDYEHTVNFKMLLLYVSFMSNPLRTYSPLYQWRPS